MSPPMGLSQPMDPLNVLHCVPGVPNPWAAQQEVSGGRVSEASSAAPHHSHYRLHHPPQPPSVEKLSSTKLVPGAKKVGDCCFTQYF